MLEQGWNHLHIFYFKPKGNEAVLKDKKVSEEIKVKIRLIEKYKTYFYQFFKKEQTDIYSQTIFLDSDVLTYLVIASPYNEIKAKKFDFPFVGSFPYIGFYNKKSAISFQQKLEKEDYITYIRKVDAYSSLGHFDDPIFSTLFKYGEQDLAGVVFHELFHTIFFVKDSVELNENLANYFSDKLVALYFKQKEIDSLKKEEEIARYTNLKQFVVLKARELNSLYIKVKEEKNKKIYSDILASFLDKNFLPEVRLKCIELKISLQDCFPLRYKWNNATFASYITYENNRFELKKLHSLTKGSLLDFYYFLEKNYEIYNENDFDEQMLFSEFLLQKVD